MMTRKDSGYVRKKNIGNRDDPSSQGKGGSHKRHRWAPLVDILEDDKEYFIKAELAEVKKEYVKGDGREGQTRGHRVQSWLNDTRRRPTMRHRPHYLDLSLLTLPNDPALTPAEPSRRRWWLMMGLILLAAFLIGLGVTGSIRWH